MNVADVVADADWRWAGVALALSMVTYVGATMSLGGFVPDRLSFLRTLQAQFAASFATLVSPPTLGAVAVNARFLNRSGLPPAAAAATVGVSQVAAFIVHVTLMLLTAIAAGTQADLQFNPPRGVIIGVGIAAMIIGGLASISHVRRWLTDRIRPMIEQVIPRLATVAQRPAKLAEGFGGILLLNVAYCLCLVASVRAFSDDLTIAAISFVYLAGSTLGQAAPTPGGLGVVEAAIAAGLTAAGLDPAVAVSATLLFRTGHVLAADGPRVVRVPQPDGEGVVVGARVTIIGDIRSRRPAMAGADAPPLVFNRGNCLIGGRLGVPGLVLPPLRDRPLPGRCCSARSRSGWAEAHLLPHGCGNWASMRGPLEDQNTLVLGTRESASHPLKGRDGRRHGRRSPALGLRVRRHRAPRSQGRRRGPLEGIRLVVGDL